MDNQLLTPTKGSFGLAPERGLRRKTVGYMFKELAELLKRTFLSTFTKTGHPDWHGEGIADLQEMSFQIKINIKAFPILNTSTPITLHAKYEQHHEW